jgi:RNA polymerase sigma factor (sigma-70 family)
MPQIHAPPDAPAPSELVRAGMADSDTREKLATAARIALRRGMPSAPRAALEQAVEEVVAETLAAAWAKAATYDPGRASVCTWIRGYVNKIALKRRDRTIRRKTTGLPEDLADPAPSAEECFFAAAEKESLRKAIDSLDPFDRRIADLHLVEGRAHSEIAAALGITDVNSRVRFCRIKKELTAKLSPSREGGQS